MKRTLRHPLLYGVGLLVMALVASTGCEPEFEDDVCSSDDECFPDEACVEERCVLTDNECGGQAPLEQAAGEPCGPCDLDLLECTADGEALSCDGQTPCPELDLITTQPTDITARTATFNGRLEEFPHEEELIEVGFCWARQEEATLVDDCASLDDVPAEVGDFSLEVDGLRPGTAQYVRAYSISDADTEELANIVDFQTDPMAPEGFAAEGGPDAISLSWDEADGATGYELIAEGETLAEIDDPEQTTYDDETAPEGFVAAPQNFEASMDLEDGIEVSWDAPDTIAGASVEYELIAIYPDATSEPTDPVEANRDAPEATGFEIYIGEDDPSEIDWTFLGEAQSYFDENAPLGVITPGTITASKGEFADFVRLQFEEAPSIDVPQQSYQVRATYGDDDQFSGESTPMFQGQRQVGDLAIQWFRSPEEDADFPVLIEHSGAMEYDDVDAPEDGTVSYYHATVSAPQAHPANTNTDTGYVATAGEIMTPEISDIESTEATVSVSFSNTGVPPAGEHGICFSSEAEPSYDDANCIEFGATDEEPVDLTTQIEELAPGTNYFVRAFLDSEITGTLYSEEATFTTTAPSPQGLATESTLDSVIITWDAADGATGYRLYADGAVLHEFDDPTVTQHEDDEAATAGFIGVPDISAEGTIDGIELSWDAAEALEGESVDYQLVATYPDVESDPTGEVVGARLAPDEEDIQGYELSIDGEDPISFGSDDNEYFDGDAPMREIDAGEASASKGEFETHVALEVIGAEVTDAGARTFELRTIFGDDEEKGPAVSIDGHRDAGEFEYQWYRTTGEEDVEDDYATISGATEAQYDDEEAPEDGSQRYYRAEISAPGAEESVLTAPDFGFRSD